MIGKNLKNFIYNLEGESQSKNFQIEIDYSPSNLINLRFAYKDYDVKADYINGYLRVPMIAKTRFFQMYHLSLKEIQKGLSGGTILLSFYWKTKIFF